jgi:hypothetical protein
MPKIDQALRMAHYLSHLPLASHHEEHQTGSTGFSALQKENKITHLCLAKERTGKSPIRFACTTNRASSAATIRMLQPLPEIVGSFVLFFESAAISPIRTIRRPTSSTADCLDHGQS